MKAIWKRLFLSLTLVLSLASAMAQTEPPPITATCQAPAPTDSPNYPQGVAAGDQAFFIQQTVTADYHDLTRLMGLGYTHIVGGFAAVTVYPCNRGRPAKVGVKAFRLEHQNSAGGWDEDVVVTFGRGYDRPWGLRDGIWYREPAWFTSGKPEVQPELVTLVNQTYLVDVAPVAKGIYHAWTNPRVSLVLGRKYRLNIVVWLEGDACFQPVIDVWKGPTSDYIGWSADGSTSNNFQIAIGNWTCNTNKKNKTLYLPQQ